MHAYEHDSRQKAKARKSGPSFLEKSNLLGVKAHTLSIAVYWEPTHREYRTAVYVPEGWSVPDLNGMIADTIARRTPLQPPHPPSPARSARRQALRVRRPQAATSSSRREVRPVRLLPPVRRSTRQQSQRTGEQLSSDTDASVDIATPEKATDSEASGGSVSSLHGGDTDTARHTWGEGDGGSLFEEPHAVARPGVENPTGRERSGAGATCREEWQEAGTWSHVNEPIYGDAMLADVQADLPQSLLNDGYLEWLPHNASPFETASWMDVDFLGNSAHGTSVGGSSPAGAQQAVMEPASLLTDDPTHGRVMTPPLPNPSTSSMTWSAWRTLARDSLALMDRILAAGAHSGKGRPLMSPYI